MTSFRSKRTKTSIGASLVAKARTMSKEISRLCPLARRPPHKWKPPQCLFFSLKHASQFGHLYIQPCSLDTGMQIRCDCWNTKHIREPCTDHLETRRWQDAGPEKRVLWGSEWIHITPRGTGLLHQALYYGAPFQTSPGGLWCCPKKKKKIPFCQFSTDFKFTNNLHYTVVSVWLWSL